MILEDGSTTEEISLASSFAEEALSVLELVVVVVIGLSRESFDDDLTLLALVPSAS